MSKWEEFIAKNRETLPYKWTFVPTINYVSIVPICTFNHKKPFNIPNIKKTYVL